MNKRLIFSSLTIFIMFGILICLYLRSPSPSTQVTWTLEKQREYANKLKAEGLKEEAIQAYEKYLQMAQPEPEIQANIYYTMAKMAEGLGQYENALAYLYRAEIAYPETKLKAELGELIVNCLESMGRGLDAQYKLEARTALEPAEKAKGKVLARIGKEVITEEILNQELQKLPQKMQEEYQKPDKKAEFLKQYLAIELLSRKARRLGYDKDPKIRTKVADITKELIVEKLLKEEMEKKVEITPNQLELYYKANRDQYAEPAKAKIEYIMAETEEGVTSLKEEPFKEVEGWIEEGQRYIPDIGSTKELVDLALSSEIGKTAGPIKAEKGFYIIKVLEKKPEHQLTFEEVKDRVSYEYQMECQQAVYQELLEDTLRAEEVEIYEN